VGLFYILHSNMFLKSQDPEISISEPGGAIKKRQNEKVI